MAELNRSLGFWGATGIGIGAIIGTGIFVLIGVASGIAGPAVILSFVIAGIVAMLTGLSTAELASFIHEAGGSYIYTTKAFGPFPGFIVGWMNTFDYIVGTSAVSVGFAAYLAYFLGIPPTTAIIVSIGTVWPLILTLLNLKGIREASGTNNLLVALKISALIVFIIVCAGSLIASGNTANYHPFFPTGLSGVMSGAAIIFFAFVGFNTIAIMAEEIHDPAKNVPRAILFAFGVCMILYVAVSIVAVGIVNWQQLGSSRAPLEFALEHVTKNIWILQFVAISALFATTSVIMASIMGGSRALFAMARQGVLPKRLATISRQNVPVFTILAVGIIISGIVLVTGGNLDWLASIFNFGTLLTFFFINLSLIRLRTILPDAPRAFRVPLYPVTPVLALISCIALAAYLNPNALMTALIFLAIGVIFYAAHQRQKRLSSVRAA